MLEPRPPPAALTDLLFEEPAVARCLVAPDGTVLRASRAWPYAGDAATSRSPRDVDELFPGMREAILALHARARAGERVEIPRHARQLAGRDTWWDGTVSPVQLEAGVGSLISLREVSGAELPRATSAAAAAADSGADSETDGWFRLLAQAMPQIVCVIGPDGAVQYVNQAWATFAGKDLHATSRAGWAGVVHPEDLTAARECLRRALRSMAPQDVEIRYRSADGTYRWYLSRLAPVVEGQRVVRLIGAAMDIDDRKRVEEALRASEERLRVDMEERRRAEEERDRLASQLRVALDAARMGWWHYDPATREATFDRRYTEIFGVTGHQRPNDEILKLLHPNDLPRVWTAVQAALSPADPRPYSTEYRIIRPDGALRWVEAHGLATFEGEGPARRATSLVGTVADITERKQAEEVLRRHEVVVQHSRDTIFFIRRDDGRILDANPAGCAAYGYTHEELLSLSINDLRAPETWHLVEPQMAEAGARGVLFESLHRRKDGTRFPVEVSSRGVMVGSTQTLVSVVRDITDRKRAETALREREALLQASAAELAAVFNSIADGVLVCDAQGRVVRTNPAVRSIFGLSEGELRGSLEERLTRVSPVYESGEPILPRDSASARALRGETLTGVTQGFRRPGETELTWVTMSAAPVVGSDGTLLGAVVTFTDLTERKKAEHSLREADRRKDEFLSMLSHELRNPLAPIRNSAFILRHAQAGSEQARRAQTVIERQTEHLTRLVDDLLDVTRIARGKIELRRVPMDLREVVARACDDFRLMMEDRGVAFRTAIPGTPIWAVGDPTRITQIVGNLLHNAAKFTPRGGEVTVSLVVAGGEARVRVRDTGAGIEPVLLPHVFDPFVQGERTLARTEGGLGLGLALVKGLTELHGGRVHVESAGSGCGAEFLVRLPLATGAVTRERPGPELEQARRGRRVLVVDDNRDAAASLADLVAMLGHEVEVAFDGPSALARARASRPEAVLCDLGLPGMSGYEIARTLRDEGHRSMQLLAVSGYAQPEDVRRALEAGFDAHLAKPCDPADVERLLG